MAVVDLILFSVYKKIITNTISYDSLQLVSTSSYTYT